MINFTAILNQLLHTYSVKHAIDPKVVQYVVSIMNYKNEQLAKPAFTYIYIIKLVEKFINVPNAAAVKSYLPTPYLYLSSTMLDILEHGVLAQENQTYTLTCIGPVSPYTMKVSLPKRQAERMTRALIEHELGHVYHPHHCRLYAPAIIGKLLLVAVIAGYAFYKKFMVHTPLPVFSFSFIGKYPFDWPFLLLGVAIFYSSLTLIPQLRNSSFTSSTHWEEEADEFISNDKEILEGIILFLHLDTYAKTYIYSYENWWIRLHAWWKALDCAEFAKRYSLLAHNYFERSSSLGEAYHPLSSRRIARFEERIAQLPATPLESDDTKEHAVITIFKETQIVEKITF